MQLGLTRSTIRAVTGAGDDRFGRAPLNLVDLLDCAMQSLWRCQYLRTRFSRRSLRRLHTTNCLHRAARYSCTDCHAAGTRFSDDRRLRMGCSAPFPLQTSACSNRKIIPARPAVCSENIFSLLIRRRIVNCLPISHIGTVLWSRTH
jgi:hypothetical protein